MTLTRDDLFAAVNRLQEQPHRAGYAAAVWLRDLLLCAWCAHHPERAPDLWRLTYREDNTGHIVLSDDGLSWRYQNAALEPDSRQRGAYQVAPLISQLIPIYLSRARLVLCKKPSDSFFYMPSSHLQRRVENLLTTQLGRPVGMVEIVRLGNAL